MTSPPTWPDHGSTKPLEEFAASLRRLAAGISVKPPEVPGGPWRSFRPGVEVAHPATAAQVMAFTEMTPEQATMALAVLELGEPHDAVALDLLNEAASAAIAVARAVEAFNGHYDELDRLLTWAGERLELQ